MMSSQRAASADHISLTTVCADNPAGDRGNHPSGLLRRADRVRGEQHATDTRADRAKRVGCLM